MMTATELQLKFAQYEPSSRKEITKCCYWEICEQVENKLDDAEDLVRLVVVKKLKLDSDSAAVEFFDSNSFYRRCNVSMWNREDEVVLQLSVSRKEIEQYVGPKLYAKNRNTVNENGKQYLQLFCAV